MKISSIRHVAFVVKDLNKSIYFYRDILGLKEYRREVEEGDFIEKLTGIKSVKLEWIKLIIPERGLIELLQYHSHPDKVLFEKNARSNQIGCSHVALTVSDLDNLYYKLSEENFICKSKPLISPNRLAKVLYCHDPDGSIIELIEDLN